MTNGVDIGGDRSGDVVPGGSGSSVPAQVNTNEVFARINKGVAIAERLKSLFGKGGNSEQFQNMAGTSTGITARQPNNLAQPTNIDPLGRFFQTIQGARTAFPQATAPINVSSKTAMPSQFLSPPILIGLGVGILVLVLLLRRG